jgi:hypothetical protein
MCFIHDPDMLQKCFDCAPKMLEIWFICDPDMLQNALGAISTRVFCSRFSVRAGAAAQLLPLLFSRDHAPLYMYLKDQLNACRKK